MRNFLPSISVVLGIIASILVFTPLFKTPPLAIAIFSILGFIVGVMGLKEMKPVATIGIILSVVSFAYLIYLYIQLGG